MIDFSDPDEIVIDKEGLWHYRGAEMKRADIVHYLYQYLKKDEKGDYLIEIDDDRCPVRVADAPYVVRGVTAGERGVGGRPGVHILLNDGTTETLNLETPLRIGEGHVLYCRVKKGEHEARFSRPAYYQICHYLDYDSGSDTYRLVLDQVSYPLVLTGQGDGKTGPTDGSFDKPI
ncbi:MAG: hypothetical protein AB1558_10820 [Thermodesulfobacteriota bacterium]